jgi:hypothetical protein
LSIEKSVERVEGEADALYILINNAAIRWGDESLSVVKKKSRGDAWAAECQLVLAGGVLMFFVLLSPIHELDPTGQHQLG